MQIEHDNNLRKGSYLRGFIGALLGAGLGCIPALLLMFLLNIISGWLCALIPIASYYGYKLLGGKRTKLSTVFVLISSVLAIFIIDYFYLSIMGYGRLMPLLMYYFSFISGTSNRFALLGQEALFVLLGIAFAWNIIRRNGFDDVNNASFSAATLRPMYPLAGVPMQPVAPAGMPAQTFVAPPMAPMPTQAEATIAQPISQPQQAAGTLSGTAPEQTIEQPTQQNPG